MVGLGRALLSNGRPSWRLPPISDPMAERLAPFPWVMALVAIVVWAPTQINAVVEASFAAVVATHVMTALILTAMIGAMLLRLHGAPVAETARGSSRRRKLRRARRRPSSPRTPQGSLDERPMWVSVLLAAVTLNLIGIWVLVAIGYVAMASFLASQLTWAIVAAAFYVLFKFADDLFVSVVSSRSNFGQRLQLSFGLEPRRSTRRRWCSPA